MKKVDICRKEFDIDCNAFTYVEYRKKFKDNGIFEDFETINNFTTMQVLLTAEIKAKNPDITETEIIKETSRQLIKYMDDYVEALTRVAYICCYKKKKKGLTRINTNDMWIVEVTELAVNCFCGREGI